MSIDYAKVSPPTDDKRWRQVNATMRRNGGDQSALIETLHTVQDAFGYLDADALRYVALSLRLPLSKVFGVATFYHYFSMKAPGKHTCVVCTGTACYIKGVPELLSAVKAEFGIGEGQTTPDGELSVMSARCLGACGIAPVAVIDGEFSGKLTPAALVEKIKRCKCHEQ